MDNNFLRQFLQSRVSADPKANTSKTVRNGVKHMPEPTGTAVSIQTIIEDLPDKKVVLEYFKQRIQNIEDNEFED